MRKCKIILSMALVLMLAWLNVFSAGLVPAAVPVLSAAAAEADLWLGARRRGQADCRHTQSNQRSAA